MNTIILIKRVAAAVLLVAFFLPLTQCTREQPNPETGVIEQVTEVTYAYSEYTSQPSYQVATYVAFLWPMVFSFVALAWNKFGQKPLVGAVEILLCAGSAYMLFALTLFGTLLYGAYIAGGAITLYLFAILAEFAIRMRMRWTKIAQPGA